MRHQEVSNRAAYDVVAAPAEQAAAKSEHAPAAPDMPKAAGLFMVAAYAALMGAFALTIHGARADFAIVIAGFYVAMFFALPAVFLGIDQGGKRRPSLAEFLERGIDTATGRTTGTGALVQMLIVPVLLAFAILAMGITYLLV